MSAILLDIEGTVSDKRFVSETLFPFARERIARFLRDNREDAEVKAAIAGMRIKLARPDATLEDIGHALEHWIDEDRKEEPLKSLQGLIWRGGYESGALLSHIYADVPPALARWRAAGKKIAIFSSGSIAAQKLLFAHTSAGDLTHTLSAYFDLSTGPKFEPISYLAIARALDLPPTQIRFYSDAAREIEAALVAGMDGVLVERDGPIVGKGSPRRISDFTRE